VDYYLFFYFIYLLLFISLASIFIHIIHTYIGYRFVPPRATHFIICVVTQFWIHQDFFECYFISIIIYKNPKKLRKSLKIQKYIFLESTASFHQNRVYRVNTGQTMSTRVKNEFRAVSGQNRYF